MVSGGCEISSDDEAAKVGNVAWMNLAKQFPGYFQREVDGYPLAALVELATANLKCC